MKAAIEELLRLARAHRAEGRLQEAGDACRLILASQPENIERFTSWASSRSSRIGSRTPHAN